MLSVTLVIVVITAITSFLAFNNRDIIGKLIFSPSWMQKTGEYYRFLSHGLIHADFMHLLFNMYTFYLFGGLVESIYSTIDGPVIGKVLFSIMYLSALVASSMKTFFEYRHSPSYSALGASGAVSAVVFSGIALYPQMSLYLFFIPVPIPAWLFAGLYLVYSAYMSKKNYDNIGHDAHFWGAVYGVIFTGIFFFPAVIMAWRNLLGL